ncbi:MAG: hypothetical protein IIU69_00735 [Bacteroidaceae bacterium]|nr:hypothetical protein [Bacteroidaceae bacterium]
MNRYIVDIFRKWSFLVVLVLLMAGCTSEFDEFETGVKVEFTTPYLQDMEIQTKAPSGYGSTVSGSTSMGVFVSGMQNESTVTYNGSSWESSLKLDPATYKIYSYIPKRNGVSFSGNVITFTDVPFIMSEEILLSSGAVAETVTKVDDTYTPSDKRGSLVKNSYSIKVESAEDTRNYVTFMMDRVMAKVNLNFKVHEKYSKIRTIKIKEVTLKPAAGNYQSVNIACTMNEGSEISYSRSPGSAVDHSVSFSPVNLELMNTSEKSVGTFYSVPGVQNNVVMTVKYDVYDKAETLVRENQTVTNSSIKLIETGTLARAKEYKLNVNIVPTYLYSLSDTDKESVMLVQ